MLLDLIFRLWRHLRGPFQWWTLWLVNSKFMVSVSGAVFDEYGNVLLQRHRHWVPDVWGLPGGIVRSGESLGLWPGVKQSPSMPVARTAQEEIASVAPLRRFHT